jgi:hypothetical protein
MPATVLDAGDTAMIKMDIVPVKLKGGAMG